MINPTVLKKLKSIVGEQNISLSDTERADHATDRSFHKPSIPEVVIWPKSSKDVRAVLKIANKHTIPITARGGGSSLEGQSIPVQGGIVLNMTRMNAVLEVKEKDMQVIVEPGIVGDRLNEKLKKYNLFFPAFPGSSYVATIGGMIANNAGGMYGVKYGVVADWILEIEVVLANGAIITLGNRSFKTSSGYNLKRLFIGSEGTLGIVTKVVLKLAPLPPLRLAALISFPKTKNALDCAHQIHMSGIEPAAIEFMDKTYVSLVNKAAKTKLSEDPSLIIELHGTETTLFQKMKALQSLCKKLRYTSYKTFTTDEERKLLWEYRRAVRPVLGTLLPNTGVLSAEVGLPLSAMLGFLQKAEELSKQYNLQTTMFGHLGDGNFHGWALYELGNKKSWEKVTKLNEELITFAINAGGTTTGEHGIGIGKRKFLKLEHQTGLPLMRSIKDLLDPNGILNPGKIFPD